MSEQKDAHGSMTSESSIRTEALNGNEPGGEPEALNRDGACADRHTLVTVIVVLTSPIVWDTAPATRVVGVTVIGLPERRP